MPGNTGHQRVEELVRMGRVRTAVEQLRDRGMTFEAIGRALNISRQAAWACYQDGISPDEHKQRLVAVQVRLAREADIADASIALGAGGPAGAGVSSSDAGMAGSVTVLATSDVHNGASAR